MKARYIRDVHEPRQKVVDEHRDELVQKEDGEWYWPEGTVEDHPRAYMLVRMGTAEPDDEECAQAARMTREQMERAQRHADALAKGIQPEDYGRYFAGELAGYNPDGSDIPGPNWIGEPYDGPLELPPSYGE